MVATKRKAKGAQDTLVGQMKRALRKAERDEMDAKRRAIPDEVSDAGTGGTILRMSKSPMERLLNAKEIGSEEQRAADEIAKVVHALHMGLGFGQPKMEFSDRSHNGNDPPWLIDAYARYKAFGDHWSKMKKLGDPTWQIVFDAVWDERPFHILESDLGLKHGTAKKALIAGLRDYAARAGWVDKGTASIWLDDADKVFRRRRIIGEQLLGDVDEGGKISA